MHENSFLAFRRRVLIIFGCWPLKIRKIRLVDFFIPIHEYRISSRIAKCIFHYRKKLPGICMTSFHSSLRNSMSIKNYRWKKTQTPKPVIKFRRYENTKPIHRHFDPFLFSNLITQSFIVLKMFLLCVIILLRSGDGTRFFSEKESVGDIFLQQLNGHWWLTISKREKALRIT